VTRHRARKRFGQHFLTDPGVIDAIVRAITPRPDDVIVEIGPGQGAITSALAAAAGQLHCVELDRDLAGELRSRYGETSNVRIHQADALEFEYCRLGASLRVVGNLPYNISTPLLFRLLDHRDCIADMHFMLQKEVVDRMAASPGSKAYGRLGIMLGCHLEIESLFDVGPDSFQPPPAVMSAVVRLRPLPPGTHRIDDEDVLRKTVATAFSHRRKTLRNALKPVVSEFELRDLGIEPGARPETLPIADYVTLANYLARRGDNSR
jgi:16S rRNA (adenine1518-N6/adenine1519-N6)-dimethyltransferase